MKVHLELTARCNSQEDKTTQNSGNENKERQGGNSLLLIVCLSSLAVPLRGYDRATPRTVGQRLQYLKYQPSIQRCFLLVSADGSGEQDMGRTSQDSMDIQMPRL